MSSSLPSLRRVLCFLATISLFCLPCFSQDFQPEKVYQVTGAQLNKLTQDFKIAEKALRDSQAENETLRKQSNDKLVILEGVQKQLQTVSRSFETLQTETLINEIKIGLLSFASGVILFEGLHLVGVIK